MLSQALQLTVWLSVLASVVVGLLSLRLRSRSPLESVRPTALAHPLTQFLVVCGLLYVNQVLFSVYVLRAHGGNVGFVGQYIGGPWFAIGGRDPLVQLLAAHVHDGRLLSFSLLRVQAFLELPFTMFAYLAVARLYGHRLYVALCRLPLLFAAAISFSVTFSIIELFLPNPWTHDDLALRALSALVTPVYIAWTSRRVGAKREGPTGTLGILAAFAGAGAISYVVLAMYDAFLLYNLGHLHRYASGLPVAIVIAALASFAAARIGGGRAGVASDAALSTLRAFTVLFFVPSLSLRYWGSHREAAVLGLFLVSTAVGHGAFAAIARSPSPVRASLQLAFSLPFAVLAGGAAAWWAMTTVTASALPELVLARLSLSFLCVTIVVLRGLEFLLCCIAHETKAAVDQA